MSDQKMDALAAANAIRSKRAECRRRMSRMSRPDATALVVNIIARPPEWAQTWAVARVLSCIPYVGQQKVSKILRDADVDGTKRLAHLTPLRRSALIDALAVTVCGMEAAA